METDAFLGVGWNFPVKVIENKIVLSKFEQDIKQSIRIILGTKKGERVMHPDFGCGIHDYVFDTINISTLTNIKTSIQNALFQWEPRIEVLDIHIDTHGIVNGKLIIYIKYRIRSSNSTENLVYDFFINEGT